MEKARANAIHNFITHIQSSPLRELNAIFKFRGKKNFFFLLCVPEKWMKTEVHQVIIFLCIMFEIVHVIIIINASKSI